jgi:hypothetical protein
MKTIDIKGKSYVQVNERILHFRKNFPDYTLESTLISDESGRAVFKAKIKNADGIVVATGHAYELEGSSFINKTSYIENCETSAWGRALGCFGIGIQDGVASAEEVGNAVKQQATSKPASKKPTHKSIFDSLPKMNEHEIAAMTSIFLIVMDNKVEGMTDGDFKLMASANLYAKMGHWPTTEQEQEDALAILDKEYKK